MLVAAGLAANKQGLHPNVPSDTWAPIDVPISLICGMTLVAWGRDRVQGSLWVPGGGQQHARCSMSGSWWPIFTGRSRVPFSSVVGYTSSQFVVAYTL